MLPTLRTDVVDDGSGCQKCSDKPAIDTRPRATRRIPSDQLLSVFTVFTVFTDNIVMSGWSFECDERHCTTSILLLVVFAFFYCVCRPPCQMGPVLNGRPSYSIGQIVPVRGAAPADPRCLPTPSRPAVADWIRTSRRLTRICR